MSTTAFNFPLPDNIDEMLALLNSTNKLRLSVIDAQGNVQGYFMTEYGTRKVDPVSDEEGVALIRIVSGALDDSHILFTPADAIQAVTFLAGCFLGAFYERDLDAVHDEVDANRDLLR